MANPGDVNISDNMWERLRQNLKAYKDALYLDPAGNNPFQPPIALGGIYAASKNAPIGLIRNAMRRLMSQTQEAAIAPWMGKIRLMGGNSTHTRLPDPLPYAQMTADQVQNFLANPSTIPWSIHNHPNIYGVPQQIVPSIEDLVSNGQRKALGFSVVDPAHNSIFQVDNLYEGMKNLAENEKKVNEFMNLYSNIWDEASNTVGTTKPVDYFAKLFSDFGMPSSYGPISEHELLGQWLSRLQ